MSNSDIDKAFVSLYDKFFFEFDAQHEKSESQLKEIKKHERIAKLRDDANPQNPDSEIWSDF